MWCQLLYSVSVLSIWQLLSVLEYYGYPQHKRLCFATAEEQTMILGRNWMRIFSQKLKIVFGNLGARYLILAAQRMSPLDPLKRALVVVAARCRSPASNAFSDSDTATSSGRVGEVTQPKMHCFCTSPESSWPRVLRLCQQGYGEKLQKCWITFSHAPVATMPGGTVAQQKSQQYFSSVKVQQCANRTRSGPLQLRVKKGPDATPSPTCV